MRLYQFKKLAGNKVTLSLLQRTVMNQDSAKFIIVSGVMGTGKSSSADIIGLYKTCENPSQGEPCLVCETCKRNINALETNGSTTNLVKKNIGMLKTEAEMRDLVDQIFTLLQGSVGENVYILEEAHAFSSANQTALLSEFDRLGENTTVIMTTTNSNKLLPELKSRALTFNFSRLSQGEMKMLLDQTAQELGIKRIDSYTADLLLRYSKGIPRDLVKMINFIKNTQPSAEELSQYMGFISNEIFLDLIASMKSSMRDFMSTKKHMMERYQISDIIHQLKIFVENTIFYLETNELEGFTDAEAKRVLELIPKPLASELGRFIVKFPTYGTSEEDFSLAMINLRNKVIGKGVAETFTENSRNASKQKVESEENFRVESELKATMSGEESKKISMDFLKSFNDKEG